MKVTLNGRVYHANIGQFAIGRYRELDDTASNSCEIRHCGCKAKFYCIDSFFFNGGVIDCLCEDHFNAALSQINGKEIGDMGQANKKFIYRVDLEQNGDYKNFISIESALKYIGEYLEEMGDQDSRSIDIEALEVE